MARCLRSPEIEAMFKILKLRVDELRLDEARVDEWRVVGPLFIEARWHRGPNKSQQIEVECRVSKSCNLKVES